MTDGARELWDEAQLDATPSGQDIREQELRELLQEAFDFYIAEAPEEFRRRCMDLIKESEQLTP